jgi:hypothetical protein
MGRMVLERPFRASLLGFESDTGRLAKAGWRFSVETEAAIDPLGMRNCITVLADFKGKMFMQGSALIDKRSLMLASGPQAIVNYLEAAVSFEFAAFSDRMEVVVMGRPAASSFTEIEPFANYKVEGERLLLSSLFTPVTAPQEHEIIVSPDKVPGILEAILKAQQPKQAEIRESARKGNARKTKHASVISLAA